MTDQCTEASCMKRCTIGNFRTRDTVERRLSELQLSEKVG